MTETAIAGTPGAQARPCSADPGVVDHGGHAREQPFVRQLADRQGW
jgi:hypothetical protein